MKKLSILLSVLVVATSVSFAQESVFNKGDKALNLGIGFGSILYMGSYYSTQVPPVSASLEYGYLDGVLEKGVIGLGGYVGYSAHKWEYYNWGWRYTTFIIGARGTFHYPLVDKMDTYMGLLLGARIVSSKEFGTNTGYYDYSAAGSGLAYSWFVGARYFFTPNFAVMGELGYGISYINLGIALKI